jgi:hypothetical protein
VLSGGHFIFLVVFWVFENPLLNKVLSVQSDVGHLRPVLGSLVSSNKWCRSTRLSANQMFGVCLHERLLPVLTAQCFAQPMTPLPRSISVRHSIGGRR